MSLIKTLNSTYEVDFQNQKVRRVEGVNPPTECFSPEGEWKDYREAYAFNDRFVVIWPDGKATVTSLLLKDA